GRHGRHGRHGWHGRHGRDDVAKVSRASGAGPPQRIPRPASVKAGVEPPWAALAPSQIRPITLERVRAAVAARPPRRETPPPGARVAAVLIALFEEEGEARVVLS